MYGKSSYDQAIGLSAPRHGGRQLRDAPHTCEPSSLKGRVAAVVPTVAARQSARRIQITIFMAAPGYLHGNNLRLRCR